MKVDRASMANSLEVRAPFLDVELVEFLGRVPARLKLRRFETKHLLKRAMADVLPPGIAARAKKGFGIPVAEWFKGELREPLHDELSADRLRRQGIFEATEVQRLLAEHLAGRRDHRKQLWTLFMFQLWHRRWIERANTVVDAGQRTRIADPVHSRSRPEPRWSSTSTRLDSSHFCRAPHVAGRWPPNLMSCSANLVHGDSRFMAAFRFS